MTFGAIVLFVLANTAMMGLGFWAGWDARGEKDEDDAFWREREVTDAD